MNRFHRVLLPLIAGSALVAGCAYEQPSPNVPSYAQPPSGTGPAPGPYETRGQVVQPTYARNTGTVSSIEAVRGGPSSAISPGGAIIGAVVGGVLGNQVGEGRGRTAATVVGAGAGALAGNAVGQHVNGTPDGYRVGVQFDGGGSQYIDVPDVGGLRVGERVRVDGNQISRY